MTIRTCLIIICLMLSYSIGLSQNQIRTKNLSKKDVELIKKNGWELFYGVEGKSFYEFFITDEFTYVADYNDNHSMVRIIDNEGFQVYEKTLNIKHPVYGGMPAFYQQGDACIYGQLNYGFIEFKKSKNKIRVKKFKSTLYSRKFFPVHSKEVMFNDIKLICAKGTKVPGPNKPKDKNRLSLLAIYNYDNKSLDTLYRKISFEEMITTSQNAPDLDVYTTDNYACLFNKRANSLTIYHDNLIKYFTIDLSQQNRAIRELINVDKIKFYTLNRLIKDNKNGNLYIYVNYKTPYLGMITTDLASEKVELSQKSLIDKNGYYQIFDDYIYKVVFNKELKGNFIYRKKLSSDHLVSQ